MESVVCYPANEIYKHEFIKAGSFRTTVSLRFPFHFQSTIVNNSMGDSQHINAAK